MCSLVCGCREREEVVKKETEHVQPSVWLLRKRRGGKEGD